MAVFQVGDWVRIDGLQSEAGQKMNGSYGKVVKLPPPSAANTNGTASGNERYSVKLPFPEGGAHPGAPRAIKKENLKAVVVEEAEGLADAIERGDYEYDEEGSGDNINPAMMAQMMQMMGGKGGKDPAMMAQMLQMMGGKGGMDPAKLAKMMSQAQGMGPPMRGGGG